MVALAMIFWLAILLGYILLIWSVGAVAIFVYRKGGAWCTVSRLCSFCFIALIVSPPACILLQGSSPSYEPSPGTVVLPRLVDNVTLAYALPFAAAFFGAMLITELFRQQLRKAKRAQRESV